MRISFHDHPYDLDGLCADLRLHGAVYWPGAPDRFHDLAGAMKAQGVQVMLLCARPEARLVHFAVRADLAGDIYAVEDRVAAAFARWQAEGAVTPHFETLTREGGFPRRQRPLVMPVHGGPSLAEVAV